ncbi:hypothetical protein BGW37DRAFT_504801 [Umbelopsis sp. PMI_123]|nr:hypothetical protein BGW37DRAFT_504801 [Umbelopsis sp. PMI_123]
MRPDEHKAKTSRRYQNKHKKQGDTTAADIAQARRLAAKAKVSGSSIAAIRRRNGEFDQPTIAATIESETQPQEPRRFARRKIASNRDRYEEMTVEDQIMQDAEMGIDRETTELVNMLEGQELKNSGDNTTFFKFKEEEWLDDEGLQSDKEQELYKSLLQLDLTELEAVISRIPYRSIVEIPESDTFVTEFPDNNRSRNDKAIIPGFVKNERGLVLFKKPADPPKQEVQDGIMIRNDRSNHEKVEVATGKAQQHLKLHQAHGLQSPITETKNKLASLSISGNSKNQEQQLKTQQHTQYEDDLDSLLNRGSPADRSDVQNAKPSLIRPSGLKKIPIRHLPKPRKSQTQDSDDAFLDEMLE